MYAYIVVILVIAALVTAALAVGERFVPGSAAAARAAPRIERAARRGLIGLGSTLLLAAMLLAWQVASTLTFVIPGVDETWRALVDFFREPSNLVHLRVTAASSALAFLFGAAIGALAGLGLGLSARARLILEPTIIALNGLPKIVLYPVLLPIFMLSGSKVVMGALFALFPVLINVATGVRQVPPIHWALARSLRCSRWQTLRFVVLPGIRRPVLTGLRLAVSLAVVGVVLSEFFATRYGLGRLILHAYDVGSYPTMMAIIVLLVAGSLGISLLLWRVERGVR
ncbi:MAG: ABC transporter permease subunit [Micromonosporaceae bacterium]|nr:ABC transporter permease subunit [Micromonosporaceae bacterium]